MTSSRPLRRPCGIPSLIVAWVSLLFCGSSLARTGAWSSNTPSGSLKTDELFFERNDGQADREVMYVSRASSYSIFLNHTGITIVLLEPAKKDSDASPPSPSYFRLAFENANSQAQVAGVEQLPGISNYFTGSDPQQWHTRIPQFAKVRYAQLYPGIDLIFYFRDGQLEYDLVAAPDADLRAVHFRIEGAAASLTPAGDVAIKIGEQELVRWAKPHAYQQGDSTTPVAAHYSLHKGKLSFAVDRYNRMQPVVIDPALIFATYISSNCLACSDQISDIAADNSGVYLTGSTTASNFPATANGTTPTRTQNNQTFVLKLDPTGSHILYATFLGGSAGSSIAVDTNGSAYVSGTTGYAGFPLTSGVFSGAVSGTPEGGVAYATKLSADGSSILYSTLLQQPTPNGTPVPNPQGLAISKIAVDSTGALYVAGVTPIPLGPVTSSWMGLPVTAGAFQTTPGSAFVMKLNPTASGLAYSTYFDGPTSQTNNTTAVTGVAVDANGDAFVTGESASTGFPTTPGAYQTTLNSDALGTYNTAYVMKLNPSGTAPVYSTFFGGTNGGAGPLSWSYGVALDATGQAAIAGYLTGVLPATSNAFCGPGPSGSATGYVAKLTADGSALVYAFGLCGTFSEAASIGVDSSGAAYVVGFTAYPSTFQPVLLQPIQGYIPPTTYPSSFANDSAYANVVVKVDISGNLQWATFLGSNDVGTTISKIAVDGSGDAYILGLSNVPTTPESIGPPSLVPGVPQSAEAPDYLLRIAPSLGAPVPLTTPTQISFGSGNIGVPSTSSDVQLGNFGDAAMSPVISITGDFSETDNCNTSVPGGQKCDINVVFTPTATGNRTGTLTITFGGSIPTQTVTLTGVGTAPAVSVSPLALYFGVQAIGATSGQQQVAVTNTGTGPLTVASTQASSQFAATNTCGAPIAPGSTCSIQVTFSPTASGIQTGTLTLNDNASNSPQTVALTGNQTGNAAVTLAPTSLAFAVQSNGTTSAPQSVMITNSGTAPLVVSSVRASSQFSATGACPASVQPGSACTIQVTFTPSASGTQTGTLTITDNAASSPQTVSLTGNQPAGFSVTAPGGSASTAASVSAGQTATYNLSVSGTYGFSGGVNFTCSGAPANSKCSVTPNPASISGTSPVAVSVSVVTEAASSVFLRPEPPTSFPAPYGPLGIAVACALLLSFALPCLANRQKLSYAAAALVLAFLTVAFAGCGGGSGSSSTGPTQPSNPGTASGQYTVMVTGTSGSLSQSMNLSLTVK